MIRLDMNEPHVLLQLRAAWTHGGGTWALPGGALDSHEDSIAAAKREALSGFGDDRVFIEKFVERPRHIEVQVLADGLERKGYLIRKPNPDDARFDADLYAFQLVARF